MEWISYYARHWNGSLIIFIPLAKDRYIYVLDYADYETINFDLRSNITSIPNIKYIKGYGIPLELSTIVCDLKGYNIHNINQGYE